VLQLTGILMTAIGVVVVATRGAPLSILEIGLHTGDLAMLAACMLYLSLMRKPAFTCAGST